LNSPVG